jgi:hypothetical protein
MYLIFWKKNEKNSLFVCLFTGATNAALISASEMFSPVLVVDGNGRSTDLTFTDTGVISDVNVFIDFTKCDDPLLSDGTCSGSNFSFNREIVFSLTSALGTVVDLILQDTYSGSTPGDRVGILFDDDAQSTVGGSSLNSGTFSPIGSLSDFNGENLLGDWTLSFTDTVGADPLSLNAWRIDVTVNDSTSVPEPTSIALLGLGLAGISFSRKKKKAI